MSHVLRDMVREFDAAVERHDLTFQYSDDINVWRRGNKQLEELLEMASKLPRSKTVPIWNKWVDKKIAEPYRKDWYWAP